MRDSVKSVPPEDDTRRQSLRAARFEALAVVRRETHLRSKTLGADGAPLPGRQQLCKRAVTDSVGGVSVLVSGTPGSGDARAGVSGLQTCGSVWTCPVCSEKINAGRQAELDSGLSAWLAAGHGALFGTATLRHNRGHRLADLWDAISPAWNRMTSGAGVAWNGGKSDQGDKSRFGVAGYVRLVETKHGEHGWHPHVHFILFLDRAIPPAQVADLRARMFGRWEAALGRLGFSVLEGVGLDLRPISNGSDLASYFAKNTYGLSSPAAAAYEVTGSHSKRLGKGGRTPFQVLERMVSEGDAGDLDLWHEWEAASFGRRQLTWSRGMRDLLALGAESSDQELAEEEISGDSVHVIPREVWVENRLWEWLPAMLSAAELGTLPDLLAGLGITRQVVGAGPPSSSG